MGTRPSIRLLLVDDADELREVYELALESKGYEVKAVSSAEAALEALCFFRPDIVLTDLFMPGMGGLELITRLRSDLAPPVPPIIAISGFPDARAEALRRGATRFELKPLSLDELFQLVEETSAESSPRPRDPLLIGKRREATRAIGEATLARCLTEEPELYARMDIMTKNLARFFGHSSALIFLLREGKLDVAASSDPKYPVGTPAAEVLPLVNDVVEGAGAVVLSNGSSSCLHGLSPELRFVVAVPYVINREVVGAFCLIDEAPHSFDGASLGILEYITRRAAAVMRGVGAPRVMDASGLLDRAAFGTMLSGSLSTARHAGHALALAFFASDGLPSNGSLSALLTQLPGPRVELGVLDRQRVAAFAVGDSLSLARERLGLVRTELEARLGVNAIAELTFDDPVPPLDPEAFLTHGQELLTRATSERTGGCVGFLAVDARRR